MRASGSASRARSHTDMEVFTGTPAAAVGQLSFLSYSNNRTQPLSTPTISPARTTMEPLKETSTADDGVVTISDIRENGGALPESAGLGVSGANPRLVNGEAVSSVGALVNSDGKTAADVQRLSAAQSVLKKVLNVSETEQLLSSTSQGSSSAPPRVEQPAEIERGVANGGGAVVDATADVDGQSKVC